MVAVEIEKKGKSIYLDVDYIRLLEGCPMVDEGDKYGQRTPTEYKQVNVL